MMDIQLSHLSLRKLLSTLCFYINYLTVMDIQIQSTPPKHKINKDPYSTPPRSSTKQSQQSSLIQASRKEMFETPPKKQFSMLQTPSKSSKKHFMVGKQIQLASGLKRKENPESKKQNPSPYYVKNGSPLAFNQFQQVSITPFTLSRLEQDYSLVQCLGHGHFSEVGLYRSRLSGQLFAIKAAKANRMSVNQVQASGSIWIHSGQSPHIVRYYHSWIQEGQVFLVMQYCQDTLQKNIARFRASEQQIPQKVIVSTLKAALEGLAFIHKNGILHLDVKPQNILFKSNILKIADFGLSRATRMRTGEIEQGDSRYLAKELLNIQAGIDLTKADIFSLGMAIYEMLTLQVLPNNGQPWLKMRQVGIKVAGRMQLTGFSESLLKLVQKMGEADWRNRPSAASLLQSKLFKQSNRLNELFFNKSNKKREDRQVSL